MVCPPTLVAMRARLLLVVALVAGLLGACTSDPAPTATSATTTSASATTPAKPDVVVKHGDAALTAAVAKLYTGKTDITAEAHLGSWKKEKVAVVTYEDDVTLLTGPKWKVVGGWWPSLKKKTSLGKGPRFVLVLGSDARPWQPLKGTRADTIQVIGIDGKGGGGLMGMARDIWAPMPGGGKAKINAAYSIAAGKGMVQTVRRVTGLPIEGYVVTGFKGFEKIVDQSGGLPMKVAKTVTLQGGISVLAGKRKLDGEHALAYARERKSLPDGDFGRSRHQGELLIAGAIAARLSGVGIIAEEMTVVNRNADSNLTAAQALTFAASFYKLNPLKIGHGVAKGGFGTSSDGQSIVLLDSESEAMFRDFRDGRL
jgi:LCP family protein required for cell wall assembly